MAGFVRVLYLATLLMIYGTVEKLNQLIVRLLSIGVKIEA